MITDPATQRSQSIHTTRQDLSISDEVEATSPEHGHSVGTVEPVSSDYELTEDQQKAVRELEKLKTEDMEDDWEDYDYGPMPEYDVADRLKEINAQWDQEPLPENGRQRLIEFKERIVEGIAEPPDYGTDSEDGEQYNSDFEQEASGDNSQDNEYMAKPVKKLNEIENSTHEDKLTSPPKTTTTTSRPTSSRGRGDSRLDSNQDKVNFSFASNGDLDNDSNSSKNRNNSASGTSSSSDDEHENFVQVLPVHDGQGDTEANAKRTNDDHGGQDDTETNAKQTNDGHDVQEKQNGKLSNQEKVLIEINGKFELVSVKELQAMGISLPPDVSSQSAAENDAGSMTESIQSDPGSPHPPMRGRPATAIHPNPRRNARQRSQSATTRSPDNNLEHKPHQGYSWVEKNYRSPYALTPEQRDAKEKREKLKRERQLAYQERKKEEQQRKNEEAESAFQWWLCKKKEEALQQKQAGDSNNQKKDDKKEENEDAFNSWYEHKKEQVKRERLLKQREQKERDDAYFIRSREECDKAYKEWMKRKRLEYRIIKHIESTKNQKKGRKTKKSPNRKTPKQEPPPPTSKYVDYYGYRF